MWYTERSEEEALVVALEGELLVLLDAADEAVQASLGAEREKAAPNQAFVWCDK